MNIYELIGDRSTPLDAKTQEFLFNYHIRTAYLSRTSHKRSPVLNPPNASNPKTDLLIYTNNMRIINYKEIRHSPGMVFGQCLLSSFE